MKAATLDTKQFREKFRNLAEALDEERLLAQEERKLPHVQGRLLHIGQLLASMRKLVAQTTVVSTQSEIATDSCASREEIGGACHTPLIRPRIRFGPSSRDMQNAEPKVTKLVENIDVSPTTHSQKIDVSGQKMKIEVIG